MGKYTPSEIEALQLVVREGHELLKDMRLVIREMEQKSSAMREQLSSQMEGWVLEVVTEGLRSYDKAIHEAVEKASQATYDRFDRLADVMLGEDRAAKRRGATPLVELARPKPAPRRS